MHLHVVGVLVLDPGGAPDGFTLEKLTRVLDERIHLIPPLRRRLLPAPAGIDHPLWIEDPDFDLVAHVQRAPVPGPLSWAGLEAFIGEVAGRPLDRSRPLWEMWLADLDDGTVALVTKLHHSMMDGGAGGGPHGLDLRPRARCRRRCAARGRVGARHAAVHSPPGDRVGHLTGGPPAVRARLHWPTRSPVWRARPGPGGAAPGGQRGAADRAVDLLQRVPHPGVARSASSRSTSTPCSASGGRSGRR